MFCTSRSVVAGKDARASFGKLGEDLACDELRRRGYRIVDRRFRTRCGELDIIARDGPDIVFIEVKTRNSQSAVRAEQAMTPAKVNRVEQLAMAYLADRELDDLPWRIEVVTIQTDTGGLRPRISLIRDLS